MLKLKTINKKVSKWNLELVRHRSGYFYFVYDDGKHFDTQSVSCYRLNMLREETWLNEAEGFHASVKKQLERILA